jgi:transcriptional regulator with XRE-family HTH domain
VTRRKGKKIPPHAKILRYVRTTSTQAEVAAATGLRQTLISDFECGKKTPTPEVVAKLLHYYDVTPDYLRVLLVYYRVPPEGVALFALALGVTDG